MEHRVTKGLGNISREDVSDAFGLIRILSCNSSYSLLEDILTLIRGYLSPELTTKLGSLDTQIGVSFGSVCVLPLSAEC